MYRGKRCREVVERGQFDELSIAMAARLRQQVVDAIAAGRFDYSKRFPDSTTAKRLLAMKVGQEQAVSTEHAHENIRYMTVAEGVEAWLMTQSSGKSKSTAINYRSRARHVLQRFGDRRLADVTTQELQQFRNQLVRSRANPAGLSPKSANDVLTVVRGVWEDASRNDITLSNRADGITNHRMEVKSIADPFDLDEMQKLLWADPQNMASARMVVCNWPPNPCWTADFGAS